MSQTVNSEKPRKKSHLKPFRKHYLICPYVVPVNTITMEINYLIQEIMTACLKENFKMSILIEKICWSFKEKFLKKLPYHKFIILANFSDFHNSKFDGSIVARFLSQSSDDMTKTESDNILLKSNIYPSKRPEKSTYTIDLGELTHHNLKQLKVINQTIFPVSYNDKFYKDLLEMKDLVRLAYFNDIVVGGVCCRIDSIPSTGDSISKKIYIMTLGCLAPYRRLGVGKVMLEHVLNIAKRENNIESVYLHVQVNNDDALSFYKKNGFEVVQRAENYYKRIEPTDAFVVERKLTDVTFSNTN